jgi:hypothetical protein
MTKLIPLSEIPSAARTIEAAARNSFGSREKALACAAYRIEVASGCHSRPSFDPPVIGWTCTKQAAEALSSRRTYMPGGTSHCRVTYSYLPEMAEAV